MKLVAIADQHGLLPEIPQCDVLTICGDICPATNHSIDYQKRWLDKEFRAWLEQIPAKKIIGVAGNHDWIFQKLPKEYRPKLPWIYLQDNSVTVKQFHIYGTPWQPEFMDWAFNLNEFGLDNKFSLIPDGIDILLSHGPPSGFGDVIFEDQHLQGTQHLGSYSLYKHAKRVKPRLVLFGHIHTGSHVPRQVKLDYEDDRETMFVNVSLINERYQRWYDPLVIYITKNKIHFEKQELLPCIDLSNDPTIIDHQTRRWSEDDSG
jgi:Icc-related predicted phosphoesterase